MQQNETPTAIIECLPYAPISRTRRNSVMYISFLVPIIMLAYCSALSILQPTAFRYLSDLFEMWIAYSIRAIAIVLPLYISETNRKIQRLAFYKEKHYEK